MKKRLNKNKKVLALVKEAIQFHKELQDAMNYVPTEEEKAHVAAMKETVWNNIEEHFDDKDIH